MPNPTLIIGGPGSGKTDTVISKLAALYETDPFTEAVALTPTLRHGDQFRRRLVERCGVALRLRVSTIDQFSRQLASDVWAPSGALVEELLARTIRREIQSEPASYFAPIAATKGLFGLLRSSINDLLAEAIDPRAFAAAAEESESRSLRALAAVYDAYRSELQRWGWLHPMQIGETAADAVKAGAALPPTIMLDGFQLFRRTELKLLEALAERTELVVTLDPKAGARAEHDYDRLRKLFPDAQIEDKGDASTQTAKVVAGSAADREGHLRAIARQIKQRLTDEPSLRPSDFAVTFRQVSPYLGLARQVFAEYDLPLDPAAGERLSARPLGAWLRRLLHLSQEGWRLRDVGLGALQRLRRPWPLAHVPRRRGVLLPVGARTPPLDRTGQAGARRGRAEGGGCQRQHTGDHPRRAAPGRRRDDGGACGSTLHAGAATCHSGRARAPP